MFCKYCGKDVNDKATICVSCGCGLNDPKEVGTFCKECGEKANNNAIICLNCGCQITKNQVVESTKQRSQLTYILLGVFLGEFGIHNFYAGYEKNALVQLCVSLFLGWLIFPILIMWIWAIIEISRIKTDSQGNRFT